MDAAGVVATVDVVVGVGRVWVWWRLNEVPFQCCICSVQWAAVGVFDAKPAE